MSNEFNNRRSFRIVESVYLKADRLSEEEYRLGVEHRKLKLGLNDGIQARLLEVDTRLKEALLHLNNESDLVGRCLGMLNEKVDLAISELPVLRKRRTDLAQRKPQRCDLSADGIVFSSEDAMQVGEKLHIQFMLSEDGGFVECFGHVVRLAEPPDTSDPDFRFGIGVEFTGMRPEQREQLIQHMFTHETQALRMRRIQAEEY